MFRRRFDMAKEYLKPIYRDVYGTEFDSASFDARMEMQKLIYILQEAGITIGDYDFIWYKHGPYSQELQNDILNVAECNSFNIMYSQDAQEIINKVKESFNKEVDYSRTSWVECIASLQYLRTCVLPINSSEDLVLKELIARKPHLNNKSLNREAFGQLKFILGE